jgi:branched-chain amino acid transport system ATP-binding protein
MLKVTGLSVAYGGLHALENVSLEVAEGEFVTIVGPNGAGKTTLLRAISGSVRGGSGRLEFRGRDVTSLAAHQRAALGIAHVPEGRRIFPSLTVLENLELGSYRRAARAQRGPGLEAVLTLFPVLRERRQQRAGSLSGGEQQMLALGRAMMARPKLLLLDEPSLGLAPIVVNQIFEALARMKSDDGMSVLVVEQNANLALDYAARAYLLEVGKVVVEGTSDELRANESVRKSYLGY